LIPWFQVLSLKLGPFEVEIFGLLIAVGFVLGASLASRRAGRVGLDPRTIYDMAILSIFAGFLGAHWAHIFLYERPEILKDPWTLVRIWSGISSVGGLAGAGLALWLFLRWKKLPVLAYGDVAMFGLFPGWLLGRLGCFLTHDHPGRKTDFFLAVRFPDGARHDLGLYEVLLFFLLIPLIHWLGRKGRRDDPPAGTIFAAMLVIYGVARFLLDFLRATDVPRADARYGGLTPAQYFCAAFVLLGLDLFRRIKPRT
jgi:phosphatidylglycerol:prolipoprotein diacylglycerol transferase